MAQISPNRKNKSTKPWFEKFNQPWANETQRKTTVSYHSEISGTQNYRKKSSNQQEKEVITYMGKEIIK